MLFFIMFPVNAENELNDIDAIAEEVWSKTEEQVIAYMRVFMHRYHELKQKDLIDSTINQHSFDALTHQTIKEFDHERQQSKVLFLETSTPKALSEDYDLFVSKERYLGFMRQEQLKRFQPKRQSYYRYDSAKLKQKFDHFVNAQQVGIREEQVKAVGAAIRAEALLQKHMTFTGERRTMR